MFEGELCYLSISTLFKRNSYCCCLKKYVKYEPVYLQWILKLQLVTFNLDIFYIFSAIYQFCRC